MGVTRSRVAVVLLVLALVAAVIPRAEAGQRVTTRRIARGVTYKVIKRTKPRQKIRVVSVKLSKRPALGVALGTNELPGFERTSSMARRYGAIAGINGDYARPSGRPVMTFANGGQIAQTPLTWGRNFAVSSDESSTYVGHPKVAVRAVKASIGLDHQVKRVNNGRPALNQVALYTPRAGGLELPPRRACSARLFRKGTVGLSEEGEWVQASYEVDKVRCGVRRMTRSGGTVIATPRRSRRAPAISSLEAGQRLRLMWSLGWRGVLETVGGNPTLIERGRIMVGWSSHPFFRRNPRTGIGTTRDGRVLLVTVDGRQRRYSVGMSLRAFARFFKSQGARWALNLDGGGSTTMVVRGKVRNRPSDGRERPVSSALLVLRRPKRLARKITTTQQTATNPLAAIDLSRWPDSERVWSRIADDPASTKGMESALRRTRRSRR
ncbi:MAG: phosphodiester glycosidase family protein [Actinomycetota bacterium]